MSLQSLGVLGRARDELAPALASALLFGVAFPPYQPVVAAALCLVPAAFAATRLADAGAPWRAAARIGFWFGAVGYGLNVSWIAGALSPYTVMAVPAFLATVATLGALVGTSMATLWRARRVTRLPLAVLLPIVWVALEMLLERMPEAAFPWLPLGLSASGALPMAQLAEATGVHGVSALLAAVNGLIADALLARPGVRSRLPHVAAAAAILVVTFAAGDRRLRAVESRPLASVAIVQPAVSQADQWTAANRHRVVRQLSDLSLRAGADGPDLLVWPESALPGTMVEHPSWTAAVRELAMSIGAPIIFGAIDGAPAASGARWYNAAMLAEPGRLLGGQSPYYKAYLVPVIERTPFANVGAVFGVPYLGGYAPGGAALPFTLPFGRAGALICFESTFPMRSRQHRARGADVLVAISNDAWFGRSNAAHQHLAHLVLRAIETRTPVVRAANTGISAYIDPVGRIHAPTERFVPLARTYAVRTTSILTPFVRIGDAVGLLCLALALAILAWPPGGRQP